MNTSVTFNDFVRWEQSTKDVVDFKKTYVDIAGGDPEAGLALSEIVYWYLPGEKGDKLRVNHDGHYWIAVRRYEWWDRIRLSPRKADRALEILVKAGILVKRVFKFSGEPTLHIRLDMDHFLQLWDYRIHNPLSNPFLPIRENEITDSGKEINETGKVISRNGKNDIPLSASPVTPITTPITTSTTNRKQFSPVGESASNSFLQCNDSQSALMRASSKELGRQDKALNVGAGLYFWKSTQYRKYVPIKLISVSLHALLQFREQRQRSELKAFNRIADRLIEDAIRNGCSLQRAKEIIEPHRTANLKAVSEFWSQCG